MSLIKILFVCTGNTCRSPMAAAFCRKFISEKYDCDIDEIEEIGYKISSAGVMGIEGIPASNEVIAICSGKGIDARSHQSRVLSCDEVEESDYIFAMSKSHRDEILQLCPDAAQKCMLLDSSGDIGDPIGGGEEVYCRCALQIERALENRMDEILI